ncbi:imidazoleglycerol-phosphate dehydratase HisB [Caproiciproducens sp. MSJ-32]|uniref:imidazoleglycerol-phosphate dehydratase HisB n=1 Tax=Caproiciproducens sp. MSJ-32 TaxID=2841527 RepID=UPI001C127A90|nr:imidazoleglycerol-phosphate dehydratase HisB [Caproiciproducens sp. MSJ-32]MBU5456127.1 imidazoleglycerol-phosphate dehydratase HisB [Caproiciproducens sp. MSJ-32]
MRTAKITRKTNETNILVCIDIDGTGENQIDTGIGFLNHMLNLMTFHGKFNLKVICEGDLHVDDHHSVEDIGIALGQAFNEALGDKKGIQRYSSIYIPMDESLSLVNIDISGRPYLIFNVDFKSEKLGEMNTQSFKEFFKAFTYHSGITLHINLLYGENDHHKIESIFKGFSRALKEATMIISKDLPSSKGVI